MSRDPSAHDRSARTWARHIALTGAEGRGWLEAYDRHRHIETQSTRALELLRQRQLDEGRRAVAEAAGMLAAVDEHTPASVRQILQRWYFGVEAFLRFCDDDLDAAGAGMRKAHDAVVRALSRAPFLMPFAHHCHEFCLHLARIARNGRRWPEMWQHIATAERMLLDRDPLCVLENGEVVCFRHLRRFYEGIEVEATDRRDLEVLWNTELRMRLFGRFTRRLVTVPDFVIPYP